CEKMLSPANDTFLFVSRNKLRFEDRKTTTQKLQHDIFRDIDDSSAPSKSFGNPGAAGIGICYRNWEGEVLGTFAKAVGSSNHYITEVHAIIDGVEKAISKGWIRL
ncbi:hypothetical protein GIB67_002791, partial [Kingdonia uniflora]